MSSQSTISIIYGVVLQHICSKNVCKANLIISNFLNMHKSHLIISPCFRLKKGHACLKPPAFRWSNIAGFQIYIKFTFMAFHEWWIFQPAIKPEDTLFIHLLECPQYSCKSILIPPNNINIIEHIAYLRVFWSAG